MDTPSTTHYLLSTTDAQIWAQEWCRIAEDLRAQGRELIDEGWMITWFANALETGRTAGMKGIR